MRNNTNARKYEIDQNYFNEINTANKAYFLGLWYADGCVIVSQKKGYSFLIGLQERDKHILESFQKEIGSNHKLTHCPPRTINHQGLYKLNIQSKQIVKDLIKHGCVERKSLTLDFPKTVPKQYMRDFIRGYFDGDGSTSKAYRKKSLRPLYQVSFCGTASFCETLSQHLAEKLKINLPKLQKGKNIFVIGWGGNGVAEKFYHYFYDDAEIFLHRKHEILKEVLLWNTVKTIKKRLPSGQYGPCQLDRVI